MKPELIYTLKVWLTSVFVSPVLMALVDVIANKDYKLIEFQNAGVYIVFVLFALILSAPSFYALQYCCRMFLKRTNNIAIFKAMLSAVAIILSIVPFLVLYLLAQLTFVGSLLFSSYYLVSVVASIWLFRVPKPLT